MSNGSLGSPEEWKQIQLKEVAQLASGATKGRRFNGAETVVVPYLRVANVQAGHLNLSEVKEIEVLPGDVEKYRLQPGDVLMTEGGDRDKLGRGAIWRGEVDVCIHQNHIFRVRPDRSRLMPEYLSQYLGTSEARGYFLRAAKQTTGIASINITQLGEFPISLPPIEDQRKITTILSKADDIRRKREEGLRLAEELLRSAFLEMFGDPVSNERGWPMIRVDQAGEVQLGRQRAPKYQTGNFTRPYLRVANVHKDRLDLSDLLSMDFDQSDFRTYRLQSGDILLNEGQSTELVGRPAMWRDELPGCCFQNTLVRFRAHRDKTEPEFALEVFLYYLHKGQFARISSKTSNVAHLGAGRFAEMPFPLPPLEMQRDYATRRQTIHKLVERRREQAQGTHDLFDSLVHRAFRGEL